MFKTILLVFVAASLGACTSRTDVLVLTPKPPAPKPRTVIHKPAESPYNFAPLSASQD